MGHALWIEERGRNGSETGRDMSALHKLQEPLDLQSQERGVAQLSSFSDYSKLEQTYDPDGEAFCEPTWFDSASGLEAARTQLSTLEQDFAALHWQPDMSQEQWAAALLGELRWCEQVLERTVANGREFRLLVVP